ncbi:MAG: acyltransferase [Lautropia sp.]|nr:acyltransferase [Lautropia sp.]
MAVLFVLFSHVGNAGMSLLPFPHDAIGKIGVWIFFSLSAFLLTRGLCEVLSRDGSPGRALISYGIHRVMRIYPLFVVVLLLHGLWGDISSSSIGRHLLLQEGAAELWAIPVEFKYYLIVPLVALAAQQWPIRWVVRILLAGVLVSFGYGLADPKAVFSIELDLLPKITPFLLGSLLALRTIGQKPRAGQQGSDRQSSGRQSDVNLSDRTSGRNLSDRQVSGRHDQRDHEPWLARLLSPVGQVLLWSCFLAVTVLFRSMIKGYLPYDLASVMGALIALSAGGLIVVCLHPTWTAALLRTRPLVFLGEISFSLYLLHMFFVHAMERWGAGLPSIVQGWLVLALCLPVSILTWRFIERPGIQAGRYLADKLNGLMPVSGVSPDGRAVGS